MGQGLRLPGPGRPGLAVAPCSPDCAWPVSPTRQCGPPVCPQLAVPSPVGCRVLVSSPPYSLPGSNM
eukprot:5463372-Lingulodinium_polyedra.AAC.1